ncbi:MAG TPA: NAD-glutamate dehydrogenase, partial [Caulobacteraceae bacterium]|nr:NAD-glutamate dehydrogenase [Caulobacteraceae bacterium]
LSLLEAEAAADLEAQAAFMDDLEARGRLDRGLEGLPAAAEITERAQAGAGLTRPELAVLLAYGKLDLSEDVVASAAPDDPHFFKTLKAYFPKELAPYEDAMRRHRLRREIITTVIANDMVNLCGPTFPMRLMAAAGCGVAELVVSFEAAREVLGFGEIWSRVAALDGKAPAAGQLSLFRELAYVLRGQTFWLARRAARGDARGDASGVDALIKAYRPAADELKGLFPQVLSPFEQKAAVRRAGGWIKAGAPKEIAHQIALYRPLSTASVLADLARAGGWPLGPAAQLYHHIGGAFAFDRLRAAAGSRTTGDAYERLAVRRLIEDMLDEQAALTQAVMAYAGKPEAGETATAAKAAVASWSALKAEPVRAAKSTIAAIEKDGGDWSFAKLTIANAALRALT